MRFLARSSLPCCSRPPRPPPNSWCSSRRAACGARGSTARSRRLTTRPRKANARRCAATTSRKPVPPDLGFIRRERFTPVFVLVEEGREIGRIRGYPGDTFFWGLLAEPDRAARPRRERAARTRCRAPAGRNLRRIAKTPLRALALSLASIIAWSALGEGRCLLLLCPALRSCRVRDRLGAARRRRNEEGRGAKGEPRERREMGDDLGRLGAGPYPVGNPSAQPVLRFAFPAPESRRARPDVPPDRAAGDLEPKGAAALLQRVRHASGVVRWHLCRAAAFERDARPRLEQAGHVRQEAGRNNSAGRIGLERPGLPSILTGYERRSPAASSP